MLKVGHRAYDKADIRLMVCLIVLFLLTYNIQRNEKTFPNRNSVSL